MEAPNDVPREAAMHFKAIEQRMLPNEDEKEAERVRWVLRQSGMKGAQKHDTQQRLVSQRSDWESSHVVADNSVKAPFVFNFGKHKRKTLQTVLREDPGYITWCIVSKLHVSQCPTLQEALVDVGLWEKTLRESEQMRLGKLQRHKSQLGETEHKHPEVQKLMELQAIAARDDEDEPLFKESIVPRGQKRKRQHKSTAVVQIQNCTICGSADHKRNTCPNATSEVVDKTTKEVRSLALLRVKKQAAVVSRLKYTPLHQRTEDGKATGLLTCTATITEQCPPLRLK
jgi:hypothetical protein